MVLYPPPLSARTSSHTPTMPHFNSRPATFGELDTAARQNYHVAPDRKLKFEECLSLVAQYREKADQFVLLCPESEEGEANDQVRASGVRTDNTLENLERGYINYTRAQMLIEKIHRDPELEMALTEQQALDLWQTLTTIKSQLHRLKDGLEDISALRRRDPERDPNAIPAFRAADQREEILREAQRTSAHGAAIVQRRGKKTWNGGCVIL
ncbi:hypothetical protein MVEN_01651900 [Mycena venus]|uniref:Uncharacterized protein n=1 Tax=Mycena venus TaxID=2733690 RepID=A0A8H6XNA7_9AGAR|nr:hypothetical protein MVEN_01651900 [Mycena venus]